MVITIDITIVINWPPCSSCQRATLMPLLHIVIIIIIIIIIIIVKIVIAIAIAIAIVINWPSCSSCQRATLMPLPYIYRLSPFYIISKPFYFSQTNYFLWPLYPSYFYETQSANFLTNSPKLKVNLTNFTKIRLFLTKIGLKIKNCYYLIVA